MVIISPEIDAVLRAAAQGLAGWLVAAGHLDATATSTIAGILIGLATVAWSIWQKQRAKVVP